MTLPTWVDSGFILTLVGLCGGGVSYMLIFFLKSRCTTVSCCCLKCERQPLEAVDLHRVSITGEPSAV